MPSHSPWPWKQVLDDDSTLKEYEAEPEYAKAKQTIDRDFGQEKLSRSWIKTCAELAKLTKEIEAKGTAIIPVIQMDDITEGRITAEKRVEIRRVGSFIVKNVINGPEATKVFRNLKDYLTTHKDEITGYPTESPSIYCLYNSPAQNELRSHPQLVDLMRWINSLWDYSDADAETSPEPLVYADRVRIRQPGEKFMGLGPHIDSGGLCRWMEPNYRNVYTQVFEGNPDGLNCYDMDARKDADQGFYSANLQSTVLRCFQGWTALTETAPREGTILLYPNVQLVMAYILLRPFFKPPADASKVMDAEEWEYDPNGTWFPGISKKGDVNLSPLSHPHLRLETNLLHVSPLSAGDTVWWHSDVCHAVDPDHLGKGEASVAYIAATPTTRINTKHMRKQYDRMALGLPPPDYHDGIDESKLEGFEGFKGKEELFKTLMGY